MKAAFPKHKALSDLYDRSQSFVEVWVTDARGSNPAPIGAEAIICQSGLVWGTLGGGKIENHAILFAQELLNSSSNKQVFNKTWNLQKDIGMSCGGEMTFAFKVSALASKNVLVFGAGHVSQETCRLLNWLNFKVTVCDSRSEWLNKFQDTPEITRELLEGPLNESFLNEFQYCLIMTQGHATDLPLLDFILKSKKVFQYLGVIGSRAKKIKLLAELKKLGHPDSCQELFECPMGNKIGISVPREIALSIASALVDHSRTDVLKTPESFGAYL